MDESSSERKCLKTSSLKKRQTSASEMDESSSERNCLKRSSLKKRQKSERGKKYSHHSQSIVPDKHNKAIYIKKRRTKTPRKGSNNNRVYDNTHACYFCGKVVLHIKLHLMTHRNEDQVKKAENEDFTELRKLGDDKHNRMVIEQGKGEIILSRRPSGNKFSVTKFGPCTICREWISLTGISYHYKQCRKKHQVSEKLKKKDLIVQSKILAGHIKRAASRLMQREVLPIMTQDEISDIAQKDPLIMTLGETWVRMNVSNTEKRKYYASSRMRLAARLLIQLNKLADEEKKTDDAKNQEQEVGNESSKELLPIWNFLKPKCFDNVALAAIRCAFPEADDLEELSAPSNAIKLKYDIKRMLNSKWAYIIKDGSDRNQEAQDCKHFMTLMELEWKEKVTVFAYSVLNRRKYELVKEIPTPSDVQLLTHFLTEKLKTIPLKAKNYKKVVEFTQARLMMYNKRRSGELEVIKVQSYAGRSQGLNDVDECLAADLTVVEKKLLESQDLMKIRGKRGKPVPVIIPNDARKPLAFLADKRERKEAGILDTNPYLFPNSANSYARSYNSLKAVCCQVHLTAPHRITSVSMRKYTATLSQMLNLEQNQMEWVYQHLGHTQSVHKEHYRQMSSLLERTQLSKIFLIQDLNLTSKYVGKKLDQIDIKDIVLGDDDPEDLPEKLSVSEESVPVDEIEVIKESTKFDEEDEENDSESETMDTGTQAIKKKHTRQKWVKEEVEELNQYFKEFLQTKTTPRSSLIDKAKKKSKEHGGLIHMRANHLIIKKISNMNHKI